VAKIKSLGLVSFGSEAKNKINKIEKNKLITIYKLYFLKESHNNSTSP
jgi:hypothetical protein